MSPNLIFRSVRPDRDVPIPRWKVYRGRKCLGMIDFHHAHRDRRTHDRPEYRFIHEPMIELSTTEIRELAQQMWRAERNLI